MPASALVFAGGVFSKNTLQWVAAAAKQADVWCADSGLEHAVRHGFTVKVVVGDCDSVSQASLDDAVAQGAKLVKHRADKNASDLELTLKELIDAGYSEVTVLAASGGRTDHALFNWLLMLQQDWPFALTVVDETISAYLVHSNVSFSAELPPSTTLSLLCRESVSGVTTAGMKYPLRDARLMGGSTLGLSNEVAGSANESNSGRTSASVPVNVQVSAGRLLVCVVHNELLKI